VAGRDAAVEGRAIVGDGDQDGAVVTGLGPRVMRPACLPGVTASQASSGMCLGFFGRLIF
jgi:hypothetical protein